MTYQIKFILLVVVNSILILSFLYVSRIYNWDLEQRFIHIDISNKNDFNLFIGIFIIFFIAFILNFILFSWKNSNIGYSDQISNNTDK